MSTILNKPLSKKDEVIVKRFESDAATVEVSCEDPNTTHVNLGEIRLIFKEGRYFGWYRP